MASVTQRGGVNSRLLRLTLCVHADHAARSRRRIRDDPRRAPKPTSIAVRTGCCQRCCHHPHKHRNRRPTNADFDSTKWSQGLDSNQRYTVLQVAPFRTSPSASVRLRSKIAECFPRLYALVRRRSPGLLSPLLSVEVSEAGAEGGRTQPPTFALGCFVIQPHRFECFGGIVRTQSRALPETRWSFARPRQSRRNQLRGRVESEGLTLQH